MANRRTGLLLAMAFALGFPLFPAMAAAPLFDNINGNSSPQYRRVQGNYGESTATSVSVTLPAPVLSCGALPVTVAWFSGTTDDLLLEVTDDKHNIYKLGDVRLDTSQGLYLQTAYLLNVTNAPATFTATVNHSTFYLIIMVDEFAGLGCNASLDIDGHHINNQVGLAAGTDNITSGSITTTADGDLVYGVSLFDHSTGLTSAGSGYATGLLTPPSVLTEWKKQAVHGSIAATFSDTATHSPVSAIMAFRPGTVARAYDFYSKFGVNQNDNLDVTTNLSFLNDLGLKNVRLIITGANDAEVDAGFARATAYAAAGVRLELDVGGAGYIPFVSKTRWVADLVTLVTTYGIKTVTNVSGPNEVDIPTVQFEYAGQRDIAGGNAAMIDMYAAIKANPTIAGIPVMTIAMGYIAMQNPSYLGNLTGACDGINIHDYYNTDNSGTTGGAGIFPIALGHVTQLDRGICSVDKFVTSETGSSTNVGGTNWNQGSNEYVQARLLANDFFDHAMLPNNIAVYSFNLVWGCDTPEFSGGVVGVGNTDPAACPGGNWGLVNHDSLFTPKLSYYAIKNILQVLNDSGGSAQTFQTSNFRYSLSGMPVKSNHFVVQKSDGHYFILLWNETPIWDIPTHTVISNSPSSVTVTLPQSLSGSVFDPINNGTTPIATFSGTTGVTVSLNDAPIIIEVH